MPTTRANLTPAIVPADISELIVTTIVEASLASEIATTHRTDRRALTFPTVVQDVAAAWVAEAGSLSPTDIATGELTVSPAKIVTPTRVSNEALEDTDPSLDEILGTSMARSIARSVDQAVFGNVTGGVAPAGLGALVGFTAGGTTNLANLDGLISAIYTARSVGAAPSHIIVSPATAQRIALLKTATTGSNAYLLSPTAQESAALVISGVPVVVSRYAADGFAYVVDSSRLAFVIRKQAEMIVDRSVFALSRESLILLEARVGFGVLHPASVVKVTITAAV